jgi:hypothetical protein
MREAVLHLSGFYSKNFYGANHTAVENITMADLVFRVQRVVENGNGIAEFAVPIFRYRYRHEACGE